MEELESESLNAKAKALIVTSSAIIAYVLQKYHIYPKNEELEILLKCLRLPPNKDVCSEFMKSINAFDSNFLE